MNSYRVELEDMQLIEEELSSIIPLMKGKRFFLTGGTGFFGKWLLESFIYLNQQYDLDLRVSLLSRDPASFIASYPHFDVPFFSFIQGDMADFKLMNEFFDYFIHAATDADSAAYRDCPEFVFESIVKGTKRLIEQAEISKPARFLFLSSGAVYGVQPKDLVQVSEVYVGAPDMANPSSSYGEGKRVSEFLLNCFSKRVEMEVVHARCFAFAGPYIPFNRNLAAGDFIRDAVTTKQIKIGGDGTPLRSYLYTADLVIWLFTLLFKGRNREAYNVGSDQELSIEALAQLVTSLVPDSRYFVAKKAEEGVLPSRYIPSIEKAKNELGVDVYTSVQNSFEKTLIYAHSKTDGK